MNYYDQKHPVYGEDHRQISNWDPNDNPGYYEVHFRIDTPKADMYGYFNDPADRKTFFDEAKAILNYLGIEENSGYNPHSPEYLYIHPNDISGVVHSSKIKSFAEFWCKDCETFSVRSVYVYDMLWEITDELYTAYLADKNPEIKDYIMSALKTKRSNLYVVLNGTFNHLYDEAERRFGLPRCAYLKPHNASSHFDPLFRNHISDLIDTLISEGKIVTAETKHGIGYRTATMKEKRTSAKKGA